MSGLGRGSRKRGENHRACSLLHYRAIDQFGQVIDVVVAQNRDLAVTRRFFTPALEHGSSPTEAVTDRQRSTHPSSRRSPRVPGTTPNATPTTGSNPCDVWSHETSGLRG